MGTTCWILRKECLMNTCPIGATRLRLLFCSQSDFLDFHSTFLWLFSCVKTYKWVWSKRGFFDAVNVSSSAFFLTVMDFVECWKCDKYRNGFFMCKLKYYDILKCKSILREAFSKCLQCAITFWVFGTFRSLIFPF